MNKIFKILTKRMFLSCFKQFLSIILIVFLSSMLMSGFVTNYYMFNNAVTTYFDKTNIADAWFYVDKISNDDEQFFVDSKINYLKRLYIETNARIVNTSILNNAKVYVYDEDSNTKISNPYKESGSWGCVIDKNVAKNNDIVINSDEVRFSVDYFVLGEKVELELSFTITGTMSLDECADIFSAWPIFITEEMFVNELEYEIDKKFNLNDSFNIEELPYNQILIKANDNDNVDSIIESVEEYYNLTSSNNLLYSFKQDSVESVVMLNSEINQSKKMIYVFPVLFLFVSVLVILTTIGQLVIQEKQRIGTLKSIGIPDKKIQKHYSKFGAILCFLGSCLGVIFGCIIIPEVMFIKYNLVYSIPNDYISITIPYLLIFAVIVGITLLGYVVSMIACHNILHKTPIECLKFSINNSNSYKSKNKKVSKLPFSIKIALRNIKIKPLRTFMATIGISGCIALLLCGFGIGNTIENSISHDFGELFNYDISTTFVKDDFVEKIDSLEYIDEYETYQKMYVSAKTDALVKNVNLYNISSESTFANIGILPGETYVSKSVAEDFCVAIGDDILISLGNKTVTVNVTKIITTGVMNGIYICDNYGFDDIYITNGMWIRCSNISYEQMRYINSINGTNSAITMEKFLDNVDKKLSSIDVITNTLKFFAISLAVIVLLNLILLILKERIREIATMKVLGKDNFKIILSVLFEILFMSIIGSCIGILLGYPLLVLVLSINKVEAITYLFNIKFVSYVLSLVLVFFTIAFVMILCYFKVKKIDMIESLKSSE